MRLSRALATSRTPFALWLCRLSLATALSSCGGDVGDVGGPGSNGGANTTPASPDGNGRNGQGGLAQAPSPETPGNAGSGGTASATTGGWTRSVCKRGVGYGYHSVADLTALSRGVSFWYNWAFRPDRDLIAGAYRGLEVEYVPMIWGAGSDADAATNEIPDDATILLGFNEPNFGSQANLSASDAAAMWPEVEAIADARGLKLVSPAVNFCGGDCQQTDPFAYLHEFFDACDGCRVDAVAFHVYVGCSPEGDNKAQWLIDHVESYKREFELPLWLTEFACDDAASEAEQKNFLEDAVAYLESEPRVERYAWFASRADNVANVNLLGDDGQLTALGEAYVDAPQPADCVRDPARNTPADSAPSAPAPVDSELPDPAEVACRTTGDGLTTLVFVNGCTEPLNFRGSDIEGGQLDPGQAACVDIGSAVEALDAKRYWGFLQPDPGSEHHTLAEFTFNTDFNDFDWYNISHVDAHNLPMQIVPVDHADCETLTCSDSWLSTCPEVGQQRDTEGNVIACVSPDRDNADSPVAQFFEACDDAYAWSGDDQQGDDPSPVRACAGEDWGIVFCPGAAP